MDCPARAPFDDDAQLALDIFLAALRAEQVSKEKTRYDLDWACVHVLLLVREAEDPGWVVDLLQQMLRAVRGGEGRRGEGMTLHVER